MWNKIKVIAGKVIMAIYHWWLAHDFIKDREYYTWKMRRNVKDNAWWWILGFTLGVMTLLFIFSSIGWMWIGGGLTAISVWLLLHLGKFA